MVEQSRGAASAGGQEGIGLDVVRGRRKTSVQHVIRQVGLEVLSLSVMNITVA
jgi:hypothetical protein